MRKTLFAQLDPWQAATIHLIHLSSLANFNAKTASRVVQQNISKSGVTNKTYGKYTM